MILETYNIEQTQLVLPPTTQPNKPDPVPMLNTKTAHKKQEQLRAELTRELSQSIQQLRANRATPIATRVQLLTQLLEEAQRIAIATCGSAQHSPYRYRPRKISKAYKLIMQRRAEIQKAAALRAQRLAAGQEFTTEDLEQHLTHNAPLLAEAHKETNTPTTDGVLHIMDSVNRQNLKARDVLLREYHTLSRQKAEHTYQKIWEHKRKLAISQATGAVKDRYTLNALRDPQTGKVTTDPDRIKNITTAHFRKANRPIGPQLDLHETISDFPWQANGAHW
jgi:hypothetical protein